MSFNRALHSDTIRPEVKLLAITCFCSLELNVFPIGYMML